MGEEVTGVKSSVNIGFSEDSTQPEDTPINSSAAYAMYMRLERHVSGPVANGEAYLHKVALNLANDLVRQRHREQARDGAWHEASAGDDAQGEADPAPSPEREVAARQQLARVGAAITALPERAGDVFRRHRLHGESHGEIAAALGISRSAVEKHMATAMRHLAEALSDVEEN